MRKRTSIKSEIFFYSLIQSLLLFFIFSLFLGIVFYNIEVKKAVISLKKSNKALNIFVEGYFGEIVDFVNILAEDKDIIEAPFSDKLTVKRVLKKYRIFEKVNPDITYIYSGYRNNLLLINNYIPPKDFDVILRPWYRKIMYEPYRGKFYIGFLYREAKSKKWLLSTGKILYSPKYGYTGVVAIDSFSKSISDNLKSRVGDYRTLYSYILNRNGVIIVHPDESKIGKNIHLEVKNINIPQNGGIFSYKCEGKWKIAYYSVLKSPKWILITVVNKNEIFSPIYKRLIFYFILIIIISFFMGFIQSELLTKKFLYPLGNLKSRIANISRFENIKNDYKFPKNEIGDIATDIEKLTEQALYEKSKELEMANEKIKEINAILEKKNMILQDLTKYDFLTNIFNRRAVEETLRIEFERFRRYKIAFSLIMFDIDFFKSVNDEYGHEKGDDVLKGISSIVLKNIRKTDIFGRWGGEEFLILLPETNLKAASVLAKKINRLIGENDFGINRSVTVSLGVVEVKEGEDGRTVLKRVDENLYKAKKYGRNRVVWA